MKSTCQVSDRPLRPSLDTPLWMAEIICDSVPIVAVVSLSGDVLSHECHHMIEVIRHALLPANFNLL